MTDNSEGHAGYRDLVRVPDTRHARRRGLARAAAGPVVLRPAPVEQQLPLPAHAPDARVELRRLRLHRVFPARHVPVPARPEPGAPAADISGLDSPGRTEERRSSRSGSPFTSCGGWSRSGMSKEDFEATRQFLTKNVASLTKTQDAQLGYALDSRFYGIGELQRLRCERLARLTLDDVNQVITASSGRQREDSRRDQGRRRLPQRGPGGNLPRLLTPLRCRRKCRKRTRSSKSTS